MWSLCIIKKQIQLKSNLLISTLLIVNQLASSIKLNTSKPQNGPLIHVRIYEKEKQDTRGVQLFNYQDISVHSSTKWWTICAMTEELSSGWGYNTAAWGRLWGQSHGQQLVMSYVVQVWRQHGWNTIQIGVNKITK